MPSFSPGNSDYQRRRIMQGKERHVTDKDGGVLAGYVELVLRKLKTKDVQHIRKNKNRTGCT